MTITITSKVQQNVKDKFRKELGCPWKLEDGIEESIKLNLGILE